jgi:hypothetical protein
VAGLRFPCQDLIEDILEAYKIEMHHLTPNGIVKIATFIWAMKSQNLNPSIAAFCEFHELHSQFRIKKVEGRKIYKYFGCCSFKPARGAKQISPAAKNKWPDNWCKFWFYHEVPMVEEKDNSNKIVKRYPLAAKMRKNNFESKPSYESSKN